MRRCRAWYVLPLLVGPPWYSTVRRMILCVWVVCVCGGGKLLGSRSGRVVDWS